MRIKTAVAIMLFAAIEASPIRAFIVAGVRAGNIAFPGGLVDGFLIWGLAVVFGFLGGWLIFKKWNARFWVKIVTAVGIFVVSSVVFGVIGIAFVPRAFMFSPHD